MRHVAPLQQVLSIDRFSPAAGTLFVRSPSNNLPAANKSIDFDSIPAFVTKGLAPVSGLPVWYCELHAARTETTYAGGAHLLCLPRAADNFDVMSTVPALIYVPVINGTNLEPAGSLHIINVIPGDRGEFLLCPCPQLRLNGASLLSCRVQRLLACSTCRRPSYLRRQLADICE